MFNGARELSNQIGFRMSISLLKMSAEKELPINIIIRKLRVISNPMNFLRIKIEVFHLEIISILRSNELW